MATVNTEGNAPALVYCVCMLQEDEEEHRAKNKKHGMDSPSELSLTIALFCILANVC